MKLNFASTFIPSPLDQVLASSTAFSLDLTQIINRTAPLKVNGLATYSAIWSYAFSVNTDELFSEETRYTLFKRTYTNVTVTIDESIFYVSNEQEPIARQSEIIFHNLLFTIVVLELFGLLFLIIKLLLVPMFYIIWQRMQFLFKKNRVSPCKDIIAEVFVDKPKTSTSQKPRLTMKSRRKLSIITVSDA